MCHGLGGRACDDADGPHSLDMHNGEAFDRIPRHVLIFLGQRGSDAQGDREELALPPLVHRQLKLGCVWMCLDVDAWPCTETQGGRQPFICLRGSAAFHDQHPFLTLLIISSGFWHVRPEMHHSNLGARHCP